MIIKRLIRFPFLVVLYALKSLLAITFVPVAVGTALYRWVVVDEATAKEACVYWWNSMLFLWYPLSTDKCDRAWRIIRNLDKKWGTDG
jgi:hypothetical protein